MAVIVYVSIFPQRCLICVHMPISGLPLWCNSCTCPCVECQRGTSTPLEARSVDWIWIVLRSWVLQGSCVKERVFLFFVGNADPGEEQESVESTPDWEAREERRCSERRALAGHGLDMEDLASMCERQCRKACNLRSAAEELEETGSNGRARRYRKRGSPKPAAEARAMETDPSPVRLWSAADSEGHSEGYRTAYPSESEEMARPPTRANTAPGPGLEHDAEAVERPARARPAPVARHTEPTRDNMGDTPMAEESEAPGTVGCAGSG